MFKILAISFFVLLMIPSFSALIDVGTIEKDGCIELYQSCPTCTYNEIRAIKYPNGTIIPSNISMTKTNSDFIYKFCNTSNLGEYTYYVYGNKGGLSYESSEEGIFEVTPSGKVLNTSSSISSGFLLFLCLMFDFIVFFIIFNLSFKNYEKDGEYIGISMKKYIKIVLIGISYGLILLTLNLMESIANTMSSISQFSGIIGGIFLIMLNGTWIWTFVIFIWIMIATWKDNQLIKEIRKRLEEGEWGQNG